jgi:hypothetical protein
MTPTPADLELSLRRQSADAYAVELRYSQPDSDADVRLAQGKSFVARFDATQLRRVTVDPVAYGQALGRQLFADANLLAVFSQMRSNARTLDAPLRLRLFIDTSASELHALRWESLRDPSDDVCFASSERVLFSRYLSSGDWRRVPRRAQSELRALVAIANPTNLEQYQLAPLDLPGELQRATNALGHIPATSLAAGGQITLDRLAGAMRDGCDILYLVCHGALLDGNPQLWLADDTGKAQVVAGRALVERMSELSDPPRLVVLASCQSAKMTEGDSPFAALGPQLAESGVAAVVAMQGSISLQTIEQFMPTFFAELQRDGQIDRAMNVARGAVRERPDAWMPALFMRLRSGLLWYVPGFAGEHTLEQWPSLIEYVHQNLALPDQISCVPILGSGLLDALFGSSHEIARHWADMAGFPLAPSARDDLAQVAQYLAVVQGRNYPRTQLAVYLRSELLRRFDDAVPVDMRNAPLEQLISFVGARLRERSDAEPHKALAQMPFPIYITTNPDNLLADALLAAGKQPQVEICPSDEQSAVQPSVFDQGNYRPDVQHPLVYHLFGHLKQPRSLVLTEDEYFDYLIGVTGSKARIPSLVRATLADSLLLFLGFQIDDWNFRVLLRSIMTRAGSTLLDDYAHVAVQIDPEESRIGDPLRARRYLERYFQNDHINVYWGNVQDFVQQWLPLWTERRRRDLSQTVSAGATSLSMADVVRLLKPVVRTAAP